jgi:serine/threonine-protein kinase
LELRDQLQAALGDAYQIERELAAGGMARVFLAQDVALGRRVVIKTLSPDCGGHFSIERFRREIRLAASLQQANIVPLLSAGDMDGVPFYTMPFVEGESLRAHLKTRSPLPVGEAVRILRDVARALSFAHDRGVVHRDIKPENVLLSGSTAVVTDFGIAKALDASSTRPPAATLTQRGAVIGTPAYMAPEQATGASDVDRRADIYALGVLAYELLTGEPPFAGPTPQALLAAHVIEQPADIASRAPGLPRDLAALVTRCLAKDPAQRPQNANEVLTILESPSAVSTAPAPRGSTPPTKGIAVLPLASLSPDSADEYFADGLTDEIITDLSPVRSLRVIARGAMMRFKGSDKDPVRIGQELNVAYVLDGTVRRAGSNLRLTARLIDVGSGATLWADKLGGSVEDVFAMQEQVSRTIVRALQLTLSPHEEAQLRGRPMEDLRAYESYLQARQALWTFTPASLERAYKLLTDARAIIGADARLVATLGLVHLNRVETGQVDPVLELEAADACVRELSSLDPDSAARYFLQGHLLWRRGAIREAIAALRQAREMDPNNADVLAILCYAYILAGQDEQARQAAEAVVSVDPLTPLLQVMPGFCNIMSGRPDAAVPVYRRFVESDPGNPMAHLLLAWMLCEAGQTQDAAAVAERLARGFPATPFGQLGAAFAAGLRGDHAAGRALMRDELRALTRHSEMFASCITRILTAVRDFDAAMDALEDDIRLGFAHYPYLERVARGQSPLAPLRTHPRFGPLLEVVHRRWERGGASADDHA